MKLLRKHKVLSFLYFTVCGTVGFLSSCATVDQELGIDQIPDKLRMKIQIDTLTEINAYTCSVDSLITSRWEEQYLGSMISPEFGRTQCGLVGEYLFKHCDKQEGELTVLRSHFVSEDYLSQCFDEMNLSEDVIAGKSLNNEITPAIKGDIIESIIAGIYLDSDLDTARNFIIDKLHIENFEEAKNDNYKSQLQELVQANFKCTMKYETSKVDDYFEAKFYMDEDLVAVGYGKDKTKAEQNCAYVALNKLFVD